MRSLALVPERLWLFSCIWPAPSVRCEAGSWRVIGRGDPDTRIFRASFFRLMISLFHFCSPAPRCGTSKERAKAARATKYRQAMSGKASVKVKVLFFASSREAAGCSSTDISVTRESSSGGNDDTSSSSPNTADLRRILAEAYPKLAPLVTDEDSITLALNEEYVPAGEVLSLRDGDTVALIPPISGG